MSETETLAVRIGGRDPYVVAEGIARSFAKEHGWAEPSPTPGGGPVPSSDPSIRAGEIQGDLVPDKVHLFLLRRAT